VAGKTKGGTFRLADEERLGPGAGSGFAGPAGRTFLEAGIGAELLPQVKLAPTGETLLVDRARTTESTRVRRAQVGVHTSFPEEQVPRIGDVRHIGDLDVQVTPDSSPAIGRVEVYAVGG